jgi:hypothetical protein
LLGASTNDVASIDWRRGIASKIRDSAAESVIEPVGGARDRPGAKCGLCRTCRRSSDTGPADILGQDCDALTLGRLRNLRCLRRLDIWHGAGVTEGRRHPLPDRTEHTASRSAFDTASKRSGQSLAWVAIG